MKKNLRTKFVGMDVHQKSISIAIADDGADGEVRLYGTIRNTGANKNLYHCTGMCPSELSGKK